MKKTPLILSVIAIVAVIVMAVLQFTAGNCKRAEESNSGDVSKTTVTVSYTHLRAHET